MIKLNYRKTATGVPLLSRTEIDRLAEAVVYDFCPEAMEKPQPIDVEMFCEKYLGLNLEFQYLSNCGLYLGMMVFHDTNKIIVYNKKEHIAEYAHVKGGTVIIDNSLLSYDLNKKVKEIKQSNYDKKMKTHFINQISEKARRREHRYRFTLSHETAGHALLHKDYFDHPIQNTVSGIQCRNLSEQGKKEFHSFSDYDWMEWQANNMASSFLMPATMVRKTVSELINHLGNVWEEYKYYSMVMQVSEVFNVSVEAATIRLKHLGLIPRNYR